MFAAVRGLAAQSVYREQQRRAGDGASSNQRTTRRRDSYVGQGARLKAKRGERYKSL